MCSLLVARRLLRILPVTPISKLRQHLDYRPTRKHTYRARLAGFGAFQVGHPSHKQMLLFVASCETPFSSYHYRAANYIHKTKHYIKNTALQMARLAGFEPATPGSGGQCSNPLSYRRAIGHLCYKIPLFFSTHCMS